MQSNFASPYSSLSSTLNPKTPKSRLSLSSAAELLIGIDPDPNPSSSAAQPPLERRASDATYAAQPPLEPRASDVTSASASPLPLARAESQSNLHNFSFPMLKKWGSQRVLRCVKVGRNGEATRSPSTPPPLTSRSAPVAREGDEDEPPEKEFSWNLRTRRGQVKDQGMSREEKGSHVRKVRLRSEDAERREREADVFCFIDEGGDRRGRLRVDGSQGSPEAEEEAEELAEAARYAFTWFLAERDHGGFIQGAGFMARAAVRSQDSGDANNPGNNLYITGLSTRVTSSDLEKYFNKGQAKTRRGRTPTPGKYYGSRERQGDFVKVAEQCIAKFVSM